MNDQVIIVGAVAARKTDGGVRCETSPAGADETNHWCDGAATEAGHWEASLWTTGFQRVATEETFGRRSFSRWPAGCLRHRAM